MKKVSSAYTAALTALLVWSGPLIATGAEEATAPPPFDPPRLETDFDAGRPTWESPPPGDHPPGPPPGTAGRPRDRWLTNLQANDPETFEQLRNLRQEDPEAFAKAMRRRMREETMRRRVDEIPQLRNFLESLPEQEREQVLRRLQDLRGGRGGRSPAGGQAGKNWRKQEQTIQATAKAFREASPDDQPALRAQLRAELEKAFDDRAASQAREVGRMEAKLAKLREHLTIRQTNRTQIIDRRLLELTEGDPLAW